MAQAARALRKAILEDKTPPLHNLPAGHIWKYSKAIGGGAQGKAHLWVHLDETQKVIDRIVIKNFIAESKFAITEDSPTGRISTEAYISQLLVPDDSKDFYTVPILACQPIADSTGGWRTYSPYYSLGNFETLVNRHTKDFSLPEAFLWFFFLRMAKAAVAMDETLRKDDKGLVIVHNDTKPDNIFLGSPGSLGKNADFVMYPPAYLGDFGLAFTTNLGENRFGQPGGAFGWWPPEHHTTEAFRGYPFSYTNIWQIGFTILCAMTGTTEPEQPAADQVLRYDATKWQTLKEKEAFAGYSDDLLSLVYACLLCNPSDRIDPQSLLFLVETSMVKRIDDMQRWGTKSWIATKHTESLEDDPDHPADTSEKPGPEEAEYEETENETPYKDQTKTPFYPTPTSIRKRKLSGPSPTPKRLKGKTAISHETLQRRYALVAKQMQLGKTTQSFNAHSDDTEFVLANEFKLKYSKDEEFDPELFFVGPDPATIKYMKADQPSTKAEVDVMSTSAGAGDVSTSGSIIKTAGGKKIPYIDLE